jgi:outer membrane protein OmpA-like peptidoglycan-associated protein
MRTLTGAIVIVALSLVVWSPQAYAQDVDKFYKNFKEFLKNEQTFEMEALVRKEPALAAKCLKTIEAKISAEQDQQRIQAYTLMADELKELIAVTSGKKDCVLAETIFARGLDALGAPQRITAFSRAARLCPFHETVYILLGDTHRKTGAFDKAVLNYNKALSIEKNSLEAMLGMGETLFSAGLFERSLPHFEKVLAVEPENGRAKKHMTLAKEQAPKSQCAFLAASEITERLSAEQESLMCMCPQFAKLQARIRLNKATFDNGSAALGPEAIKQLDELATALKSDALKGGRYIIEGHTADVGPQKTNRTLSQQRSEAVRNFLVNKRGVSPSVISAMGAGALRGWTTNATPQGRRANRRIEILKVDAASAKQSAL